MKRNRDKRGGGKHNDRNDRRDQRQNDNRRDEQRKPSSNDVNPGRKFKSYAELMAFDPDKAGSRSGGYGGEERRSGYDRRSTDDREGRESREPRNGRQSPIRNMVASSSNARGLGFKSPFEEERERRVRNAKPEKKFGFGASQFKGRDKDRDDDRRDSRKESRSEDRRPKSKFDRNEKQNRSTNKNARPDRIERPPKTVQGPRPKNTFEDSPRVTGVVKRHPDGFGFVIVDDPSVPDVYISRQYMTGIMTNDKVEIEVYKSRDQERLFGEITKVISRAVTKVVGKYLPVDTKYGVIMDDGKGWGTDLRIPAEAAGKAKEGDTVVAEITHYPERGNEFTGRVVEVIGDIEDPLNDVLRVIHTHQIPNEFSREAVAEAEAYGDHVKESELEGREDLRSMDLITIDGATARDFDDAIYVESNEDGFHLWVAIADVSHYVIPGTQLDKDAYERGTSTYFPNYVVPMLPENLSNELCSLNPRVDRLCFVCEMQFDFEGNTTQSRIYEAVMNSKARVTYGEAQEVIDGETPQKIKHVEEVILRAADLARILMNKRFREGSLDLEIPETQVVVDAMGQSIDIIKSERLFAHRLIEEMMLIANVSLARFFTDNNVPAIFRVHEEPKAESIDTLQRFLFNFGGQSAEMTGGKLQKKLTKALQSFDGRPEAQILNILALRSMKQAHYSQDNVGHFGLGFSHYTHFTSPIRRYPDLIVHRLAKSILYPKYRKWRLSEEELETSGVVLSGHEQRSTKAERQLISIKKARFISKFVGQEFEGVISSVVKFGVFVLLRTYDVDGLVKIEQLGSDYWIFDEENLRLTGKRTGTVYKIGDAIKVQVVAADAETGRIEFNLAEETREQVLANEQEHFGSRSRSKKKLRNLKAGKDFDVDAFIDHIEGDKGGLPAPNMKRVEARQSKKKAKRLGARDEGRRQEGGRSQQGKKRGKKSRGKRR